MELIKLIECEVDGMLMDRETRVYEVYSCDMVHVQSSSSANPYWHHLKQYEEHKDRDDVILAEAKLCVMSDGGGVGNWMTMEEVMHFLKYYRRATHIVEIDV